MNSFRKPGVVYVMHLMEDKETIVETVAATFRTIEENIEKWEKTWSEEKVFNEVTAHYETVRELFMVIAKRHDVFDQTDADRLNDEFSEITNGVEAKKEQFGVRVRYPQKNWGLPGNYDDKYYENLLKEIIKDIQC